VPTTQLAYVHPSLRTFQMASDEESESSSIVAVDVNTMPEQYPQSAMPTVEEVRPRA
jgi:hypothetical protein